MANGGLLYVNEEEKDKRTSKDKSASAEPPKKAVIKELDKLVKTAGRVIYQTQSIFPFQLFPDKIIIDENKITVIRQSFLIKREYPIGYDKLVTVKTNRVGGLSSLEFEVERFAQDPRPITHLKPNDADTAKKYIIGLMQVAESGIDLSALNLDEIKKRLEEIGSAPGAN
jgi:hypothetical protein